MFQISLLECGSSLSLLLPHLACPTLCLSAGAVSVLFAPGFPSFPSPSDTFNLWFWYVRTARILQAGFFQSPKLFFSVCLHLNLFSFHHICLVWAYSSGSWRFCWLSSMLARFFSPLEKFHFPLQDTGPSVLCHMRSLFLLPFTHLLSFYFLRSSCLSQELVTYPRVCTTLYREPLLI